MKIIAAFARFAWLLPALGSMACSSSDPSVTGDDAGGDARSVTDSMSLSEGAAPDASDSAPAIDANLPCPDDDSGAPAVHFLGPLAANLNGVKTIPVSVSTSGWRIAAPGTCGACQKCGPVAVNIDGHDCDDTAKGAGYNVLVVTPTSLIKNPTLINLGLCKSGPTGSKTVLVELRRDDLMSLTPAAQDQAVVVFN